MRHGSLLALLIADSLVAARMCHKRNKQGCDLAVPVLHDTKAMYIPML